MYIIAKQALAWQELIKMIIDNFQLQVWLEKIAPSTSNDLEHGQLTQQCSMKLKDYDLLMIRLLSNPMLLTIQHNPTSYLQLAIWWRQGFNHDLLDANELHWAVTLTSIISFSSNFVTILNCFYYVGPTAFKMCVTFTLVLFHTLLKEWTDADADFYDQSSIDWCVYCFRIRELIIKTI